MAASGLGSSPRGLVNTLVPGSVPTTAATTVGSPETDRTMAAGDLDFAEFYAATFHGLGRQLYAYSGDLATAQDVVQEAFCRALPRWTTIRTYDDPAAWVRKV